MESATLSRLEVDAHIIIALPHYLISSPIADNIDASPTRTPICGSIFSTSASFTSNSTLILTNGANLLSKLCHFPFASYCSNLSAGYNGQSFLSPFKC